MLTIDPQRRGFLHQDEGGAHVRREDLIPQRDRLRFDRAARRIGGVVHEHINLSEALDRPPNQTAACRFIS
jgi:hypothetical protein